MVCAAIAVTFTSKTLITLLQYSGRLCEKERGGGGGGVGGVTNEFPIYMKKFLDSRECNFIEIQCQKRNIWQAP